MGAVPWGKVPPGLSRPFSTPGMSQPIQAPLQNPEQAGVVLSQPAVSQPQSFKPSWLQMQAAAHAKPTQVLSLLTPIADSHCRCVTTQKLHLSMGCTCRPWRHQYPFRFLFLVKRPQRIISTPISILILRSENMCESVPSIQDIYCSGCPRFPPLCRNSSEICYKL